MAKKERILDLNDIRIKGLVNRGYGMLEDGVSIVDDCICFENVYSEAVPYPMYAVNLKEYLAEEIPDIHDVDSIQITAAIYDEAEHEISLGYQYQKVAFVSEDSLDGFSGSDILPEHDYKPLGSDQISIMNLASYTGYKEDGICLADCTLEDGAGFNIQLTNGDFTNLSLLKITMIKFVFKDSNEEQPSPNETVEHKPEQTTNGKEPKNLEEIVDGKWLADLSNPDIKGYINNGKELVTEGVSQSESGLVFEHTYSESTPFAMFAVDFSSYLEAKGLNIADIKSFEIVAILFNEKGEEIDLNDEYQKCCFVTKKNLNGYSQSDILTKGNYKEIGSKRKTVFDLTKYDINNTRENMSKLEDGVGFNLQILNGDFRALRFLVISSLKFSMM